MFLFGRNKKILIDFANQTADILYSFVPTPVLEEHCSGKSKKATKQFNTGVENAMMSFAQFKAVNKPGIYGKAKLHLTFVNRLKELGYPDEIADEINAYLLMKTP